MNFDLDQLEAVAKDDRASFPSTTVRALIAEVRALRRQSLELLGVVIDVEQGGGFDDACLATIKRVMNILAGKEKA